MLPGSGDSLHVINVREKMKSRLFTQVQEYSEAKTIFLERGYSFLVYIAISF